MGCVIGFFMDFMGDERRLRTPISPPERNAEQLRFLDVILTSGKLRTSDVWVPNGTRTGTLQARDPVWYTSPMDSHTSGTRDSRRSPCHTLCMLHWSGLGGRHGVQSDGVSFSVSVPTKKRITGGWDRVRK